MNMYAKICIIVFTIFCASIAPDRIVSAESIGTAVSQDPEKYLRIYRERLDEDDRLGAALAIRDLLDHTPYRQVDLNHLSNHLLPAIVIARDAGQLELSRRIALELISLYEKAAPRFSLALQGTKVQLGFTLVDLKNNLQGIALIKGGLKQLEGTDFGPEAWGTKPYLTLAQAHQNLGDWDAALLNIAAAERFLSTSDKSTDLDALRVQVSKGKILLSRGDKKDGFEILENAYRRSKTEFSKSHDFRSSFIWPYINSLIQSGKIDEARQVIMNERRYIQNNNLQKSLLNLMVVSSDVAERVFSGDLISALDKLDEAREISRVISGPRSQYEKIIDELTVQVSVAQRSK